MLSASASCKQLMIRLNLFYGEVYGGDRWLPFDSYPRMVVRRLVRGRPRLGGHMKTFLNLRAGLEKIGVSYRVNDYRHARKRPDEPVCIIGRPHMLDKVKWKNPIIFGPVTYSHPTDDPNLLKRLPVRRILVYGDWMWRMCEADWGEIVYVCPVGIDTETWHPAAAGSKDIDVLLYDKIRWERDRVQRELIEPIVTRLAAKNLRVAIIRYGFYREEEFRRLLARSKAMVFLCEHETQGIAYQQSLSCGVPILAWDRGGYWQDPAYYPHKVQYFPVSSVPYWDDRCGVKFKDADELPVKLDSFLERIAANDFAPRDYILENLTLEACARRYVGHVEEVRAAL